MVQDALLALDFSSFLQAFVTLFAIFDPIGVLPIFVSLTGGLPAEARNRIVRTSSLVSLGILLAFAYLGLQLFQLLGITLNDFRIVGGLILLIFAVRYVLGREASRSLPRKGEEIAVFPLATPLLAGPGSISVVVLMVRPPFGPLTTLAVILLNVLLAWVVLRFGLRLHGLLGRQGSSVISRIMGLIIGAIAIRMLREGVVELVREIL